MWAVRNRTIALVVCVLVATAGCSRAEPTTPAATLGAAASPTEVALTEAPTPTEPSDPYAIPSDPKDIDKAYVERVLNALMVSIADAASVVASEGRLTSAAKAGLRATHREKPGSSVIAAFEAALRKDPSGRPFSPNATPAEIRVREIVSADKTCIFTLVRQNTSGLLRQEIKPFLAYYRLEPKAATADLHAANPTPWVIVADAEPPKNGKEYANPCDA